MLYSTYAIFASGKGAVLGATIVLALTFIVYAAKRSPSARDLIVLDRRFTDAAGPGAAPR